MKPARIDLEATQGMYINNWIFNVTVDGVSQTFGIGSTAKLQIRNPANTLIFDLSAYITLTAGQITLNVPSGTSGWGAVVPGKYLYDLWTFDNSSNGTVWASGTFIILERQSV